MRDSVVTLTNTEFQNNYVSNKGGAIYLEFSRVQIEYTTFINNTASDLFSFNGYGKI